MNNIMKYFLFSLIACSFFTSINGQSIDALNIALVGTISPNTGTISGNRYSGCWAWYQANKNKEYAISGTSNGAYFIDISNPSTPSVSAFVEGKLNCIWREIKTYQNYCYITSDDAAPNRFQIVDMQYLPDSVKVVYDSNLLFERGHTLWVDKDRLYVGGCTINTGSMHPMAIFSLATPTLPTPLRYLEQDYSNSVVNYVHDMYVRNDTIYASAGWQGLHVMRFDEANDTIIPLGSFTGYAEAGYNHSGYLTQDGSHFIFCDEVPSARPIHWVNMQNKQNINELINFKPNTGTTSHNPYIKDNFAIVSCYQDGLYIYNIADPNAIKLVGYYDTYPQGGGNTGNYGNSPYNGNWGAYPWLPSGLIVANDMSNGVFILDPTAAYQAAGSPLSIENIGGESLLKVYPIPASQQVSFDNTTVHSLPFEIYDLTGKLILTREANPHEQIQINIADLGKGIFYVIAREGQKTQTIKIITH